MKRGEWWFPILLVVGCGPAPHAHDQEGTAAEITDRIQVPPEVVANLGLTFETAKRGELEVRVPVPGFVDVFDHCRYTLRAPVNGRVALSARRWQEVDADTSVATLESPELDHLLDDLVTAQRALAAAEGELTHVAAETGPLIALAEALPASVQAAEQQLEDSRVFREEAAEHVENAETRLEKLQQLATETRIAERELVEAHHEVVDAAKTRLEASDTYGKATLRVHDLKLRLAETEAEVEQLQRRREVATSARAIAEFNLERASRLLEKWTGATTESLTAAGGAGLDAWNSIAIAAPAAGIVTQLLASHGEWVEAGQAIAEVIDPSGLVFEGRAPEGDLAGLQPGVSVWLDVTGMTEPIKTELGTVLPIADSRTRTVTLRAPFPADAPRVPIGVSATAFLLTDRSEREEVLVPTACLIQDGLEWVCFRRDPADPNQVIRTEVSLGRRSSGWVELFAGVGEGDELVADGIHQLKDAISSVLPAGGHFHADGTFHVGDD